MIDLQGKAILLHGPPGVGKTQFADSHPGMLFIATEPGHDFIKEKHQKIKLDLPPGKDGWEVFKHYVEANLTRNIKGVKGLCLDTGQYLFDGCLEWVCKKYGVEHPGDLQHGKGWEAVKREFSSVFRKFIYKAKKNNLTVIIILHSAIEEIVTPSYSYTKIKAQTTGTSHSIFFPQVDYAWYLGYDAKISAEPAALKNTMGNRVLWLGGNFCIEAKTRDPKITKLGKTLIENIPEENQWKYIHEQLNSND